MSSLSPPEASPVDASAASPPLPAHPSSIPVNFTPTATTPTPGFIATEHTPDPNNDGMARGTLNGIIIGVVLGSVGMLIVGGIFFLWHRNRNRKRLQNSNMEAPPPPPPPPPPPKADQVGGLFKHWQAGVPPAADGKAGLPPKPPRVLRGQKQSSHSPTPSSLGSERPHLSPSPGLSLSLSQSTFSYDELEMATDGFSDSNLLGQGGFGYVHKGVLRNGKTVAVKQQKSESRQGDREFCAEVEVISRVHHRHLVTLVGYCVSDVHTMLVYEFVSNKTLEFHLHGKTYSPFEIHCQLFSGIGFIEINLR